MNLLLINGSPKRSESNTDVMLKTLEKTIRERINETKILSLSNSTPLDMVVNDIKAHTHIIIGFPLYGNAMPAGLLELLEKINADKSMLRGKFLGFMIQYGFPEAIHARPIEAYLKEWTLERGANYSGAIIKGGCDGLSKEKNLTDNHKVISGLITIGRGYAETGSFDLEAITSFAGVETQRKRNPQLIKIMIALMNHFYWKRLLKRNNVSITASFARPYEML